MSNGDIPKELDRGIKELDRAVKELDRAIKELDRGEGGIGAGGIVDDVFRRVSGLGGFLVVSFIAPVAGSAGGGPRPRGPRGLSVLSTASKAEARDQEAAIQTIKDAVQQKKDAVQQKMQALQQAAKPKS